MRKILDIYKEYKIMPNLQDHMLRAGAVASLICDNLNEPLPKEEIVTACLLHDMGNIIKFDLNYFPEFLEPEGLAYWQRVKDEYVEKYGNSEDDATSAILKELNLSDTISAWVSQDRFSLLCKHRDIDDMNIKIMHYADYRVGPNGVLSYDERMEDGKKRYENKKASFGSVREEERKRLVECGREIEKQIFAKCKIKPEDMNDQTIAPIISELKNFVVK